MRAHFFLVFIVAALQAGCTIIDEEPIEPRRAKADVELLATAISRYRADVGKLPASDVGLSVLAQGNDSQGGKGPYVERLANDPWGQSYRYRTPSALPNREFDVYSLGLNGRDDSCGGDDICNGRDPSFVEYSLKRAWTSYAIAVCVIGTAVALAIHWRLKRIRRRQRAAARTTRSV